MMDPERNLGVTEARFALTILTCLLVAIGYIALLRLGGPKDTSVDAGVEVFLPPSIAGPSSPKEAEPQPRVLPLEKPEDGQFERTSRLPKRLVPVPQSTESERR